MSSVYESRSRRPQSVAEVTLVPSLEARNEWIVAATSLPNLRPVIAYLSNFSTDDFPTLILGETGVGKEYVARAVHAMSDRADSPFICISCPNIPKELQDSELFGHTRGAFTGAHESCLGFIQVASNGCLFIDEIGDASMELQGKLLRAIDSREAYAVGGREPYRVNCRFIFATSKTLQEMVRDGRFREDLLERIDDVTVQIPPLRERKSDIPVLAAIIISSFCKDKGIPLPKITEEALRFLLTYHWPGNVRRFAKVLRRSVRLSRNNLITGQLLKNCSRAIAPVPLGLADSLEQFEQSYIEAVLSTQPNVARSARILNLPPNTLRYKMKKHGLTLPQKSKRQNCEFPPEIVE